MGRLAATLGILACAMGMASMTTGCCGVSRYLEQSKKAEGKNGIGMMARGAIACAEANGGKLPASSRAVPSALSAVQGKKYMSSPTDWDDPSFKCMKFSMLDPQYFQYQWVSKGPTSGTARAVADLNGDGTPDSTLELDVTCTGTSCTQATLVRETE